jgi:hypothetical protein
MLNKFEYNYGATGFDVRNKLCYWIFFKFEMEFELKFRELKGDEFFRNLIGIVREFKISSDLLQNSIIPLSCI